jgi:diacylglycerol kinase family enzyme
VLLEVKGSGRTLFGRESVSFEITRNELRVAEEAAEKGQEFVVVVVGGVAGMGRPQIDAIIRNVIELELVPTRFIASVPGGTGLASGYETQGSNQHTVRPALTSSSWYS